MNQILENYFKVIALIFTVLTSVIFATYMLLKNKLEIEDEKTRLNIASTTVVSIYEIIHIIALIYTGTNVVLKLYTVFLTVSLSMLVFSEALYIITFIRLKKKFLNDKRNEKLKEKEEIDNMLIDAQI
jgi:cytochrome bd-type quinol oxidase subunit 2